jgi:hypothetical protein
MASLPGANMAMLLGNAGGGSVQALPKAAFVYGKLRVFTEVVTLSAQTTSDTIPIARVPKAAVLNGFLVTTDTSLGSSTIAFGTVHVGETAKFKAAATFTATNTPTWFGLAAATGRDLSGDTLYDVNDKVQDYVDIVITIGAATMPASGRLVIQTFFTVE